MLTANKIERLFEDLNRELEKEGVKGEVGIVGGALMCLVYKSRPATKDVDAIFEPSAKIRELAEKIAEKNHVEPCWLNDAVKGLIIDNLKREAVLSLSNLSIWAPEPKYMLAMKCVSARFDTHDGDDVKFLINFLNLKQPEEVFALIEAYYPQKTILPKTRFFIEELFDSVF